MGLCEGNIFPIFLSDGLFLPLFRGPWLYYKVYKLHDVALQLWLITSRSDSSHKPLLLLFFLLLVQKKEAKKSTAESKEWPPLLKSLLRFGFRY